PRGVDDRASADLQRFAAALSHAPRTPDTVVDRCRSETRARVDRRAALRGIQRIEHDETAVIDPAVGVSEGVIQAGTERAVGARADSHTARRLQRPASAEVIVE